MVPCDGAAPPTSPLWAEGSAVELTGQLYLVLPTGTAPVSISYKEIALLMS